MKKEPALTTGISEPKVVDEFIRSLKHPMLDTIIHLRTFIIGIDPTLGESISWNAPVFYYSGKMKPFNPKDYKRYVVGMNFYKQDAIRLIFLRGADAPDATGILEGDYKDGRRVVSITGMDDLKKKQPELKKIVKYLLKQME